MPLPLPFCVQLSYKISGENWYISPQYKNVKNTLKRIFTTVKGTCHQYDLNIFAGESAGKQFLSNFVMATIYATTHHVVQWNTKHVGDILNADKRLYMESFKTDEYLQVTNAGNTVAEYGQRYNIL